MVSSYAWYRDYDTPKIPPVGGWECLKKAEYKYSNPNCGFVQFG